MNKSGIRPCGHRVLVLPDSVEKVTESGIVIPESVTGKEQIAQIVATVVEAGAGAWADTLGGDWAKAGDRVYIGKFTGMKFTGKDDVEYRMVSDLDIVAVIE